MKAKRGVDLKAVQKGGRGLRGAGKAHFRGAIHRPMDRRRVLAIRSLVQDSRLYRQRGVLRSGSGGIQTGGSKGMM